MNLLYASKKHMTSSYTHIEYQDILADELSNRCLKFNNRASSSCKTGLIYNLSRFSNNTLIGVYVENMSFFEKSYGSENSPIIKCTFRGHGDIQSETLRNVLTQKIKSSLFDMLKKPLFTDDCRLVLRFGSMSTCSGNLDGSKYESIHLKCSQAKKLFEELYSTQLCHNRPNTNLVPCLYNNFVYNHSDFNNLKFYPDQNTGKFTMFNQEQNNEKRFAITEHPKIHPDENVYLLYSNKLSGLVNIHISGVYIKDDNTLSDTMKVWCNINSCYLLSNVSDISRSINYNDNEFEDDILNE